MNLKECVERGFLVPEHFSKDLIEKELAESEYDYSRAQKAFADKDYKWAIIQCYYSMFHAAKALCFKQSYREKKHIALLILLEELSKEGKLEQKYVTYFGASVDSREEADYNYHYSSEIAQHNLKITLEFNLKIKQLLNK
ncbi:MAG TPA: HEPN domain-containing protein [Candidatus Nanoarchaeia archaeon]|nr:HEPN domain-containing protein [Candidatus Nanoarchaeia archaeon]